MNLGRLTALRSLLFVFPISYRSPLPWLNQHLGRLHGLNNLEEITMNFYFRPTSKQNIENFASTSRDDWKTMDSAISLASLHSIRKINIEFVTGDDHWDLETVKTTVIESMRRLDIIGILDVKDVRGKSGSTWSLVIIKNKLTKVS
jgi:isopentenyl diphosphate isomerase/L-lactate dehydrogenase-like FMN-dependent dehydrogenase